MTDERDDAEAEGQPTPEPTDDEPEADGDLSEEEPAAEESDADDPADDEDTDGDVAEEPDADESDEDAAARDAEEAEAGDDEEPEEEPEPGAFLKHDGLESGLSWYGAVPFIPPLAPGAEPPHRPAAEEEPEAEEDMGPRPTLSSAERRQQMRERLDARRAVTKAQRTWFQRIPAPVWLSLPATLFIIGYIIVVRPWDRIPDPTMVFDQALLTVDAVEDQPLALAERGLEVKPEGAWRLLPSGELLMTKARRTATVTLDVTEPLKNCEVSVEACTVGEGYVLWLCLDEQQATALALDATPRGGQDSDPVRKSAFDGSGSTIKIDIKPDHWYELKIRIEGTQTRYFVNGYELKAVESRPPSVERIVLVAQEAKAVFRNWKITPLK
ncbi:hypothetical protein HQ576_07135 [bacterium]|nr:hypothetical protein [bacterium]